MSGVPSPSSPSLAPPPTLADFLQAQRSELAQYIGKAVSRAVESTRIGRAYESTEILAALEWLTAELRAALGREPLRTPAGVLPLDAGATDAASRVAAGLLSHLSVFRSAVLEFIEQAGFQPSIREIRILVDLLATLAIRWVQESLERKESERSLFEERYRQLVGSWLTGVAVLETATGRVTEANDRLLTMLGFSREDLEAGRINWFDQTPPEWKALAHGSVDSLNRTGVAIPYEKLILRKDGTPLHILAGATQVVRPDAQPESIALVQDISVRKRLEVEREELFSRTDQARAEAVRQREWLWGVLNQALFPVAMVRGSNLVYEIANAAYERMTGRKDLVGKRFLEVFPEVRDQPIYPIIRGVMESGEPFSAAEVPVQVDLNGDGVPEPCFFSFSLTPVRTVERAIEGILVSAHDVTEMVRARQELQRLAERAERSEQRFRTLVETTSQVIWSCSPEGQVVKELPTWQPFTGQTFEEYRGFGWLQAIHPDEREPLTASWMSSCRTGVPYHSEHRLRRADGTYAWVEVNGAPVRAPDGTILEWVGTNVDVTQRKRTSERLEVLARAGTLFSESLNFERTLAAVAELVVPALADWCFIDLIEGNGVANRVVVVHRTPADPRLVERIRSFAPRPANPRSHLPTSALTGHGQLAAGLEDDEVLKKLALSPEHLAVMKECHVRAQISVPLTGRGRVLGVLTLVASEPDRSFDAHDLQFAEELGRRAGLAVDNATLFRMAEQERQRAEEASRSKDEFLAMVSHELRTPLTSMLGYSTILKTPGLPEERRKRAVEVIDRNARVQAQLIEDLLDISRIVSGKLRVELKPLRPPELVAAALDSVRPAAEAKGIRLNVALDAEVGPVLGDFDRLQQVVWNLLTNAIKFTPRGGEVTVELTAHDELMQLSVRDTGRGISASFLPHVFERFQQAESGSNRAHGGLGLGLAIVRSLVELHGGTVDAASPGEGLGSTFRLQLPLATVRRDPVRALPVKQSEPIQVPAVLQGRHVLLVDDEEDTRGLVSSLLEASGVVVTSVDGTQAALRELEARRFDVLISDLAMPGQDGFSLIRTLRQRGGEAGGRTPAVALTAYARPEDRTRALLAGFTVHLSKPIEAPELLVVLATLVQNAPAA